MSKFKLKKKACIRAVIVAGFVALAAAGAYSISVAYADSSGKPESKTAHPSLTTTLHSGYNDNAKTIAELAVKRADAFGMADEAIENYGDVITEEQKNMLRVSESMMMGATSISEYDGHLAVFNDVVNACEKKRAQIAAEKAAAEEAARKAEEARVAKEKKKQEAEQQSQQTQQSQNYYSGNGSGLTKSGGVNYHGGRKETYYSSRVLYHYRTPEWTVDSEGFYRTAEGYYVVAASDMAQGTVFTGSKGLCQVLDSGCASGTTDYYVSW